MWNNHLENTIDKNIRVIVVQLTLNDAKKQCNCEGSHRIYVRTTTEQI
jgi:hypothetical protein